jgi:predicted nucleic acid-binding protein
VIGLDTTVLVAHEISETPRHASVRASVHRLACEEDSRFALAPQVIHEFVHVVTDPRRFETPLTIEEAIRRGRYWWNAKEVTRCLPGETAMDLAWTWMEQYQLGRKRILDTHLAAT